MIAACAHNNIAITTNNGNSKSKQQNIYYWGRNLSGSLGVGQHNYVVPTKIENLPSSVVQCYPSIYELFYYRKNTHDTFLLDAIIALEILGKALL